MHSGATESEFAIFKTLANPKRIDLGKSSVERALDREINSPAQINSPARINSPASVRAPIPESVGHSRAPSVASRRSEPEPDDTMEKQAALVELNQLKQGGVELSRQFTMEDNMSDMTFEINRIRSNNMAAEAAGVATAGLQMLMRATEAANSRWGPVMHLDGWSNTVSQNQAAYHSVFARLYRKHWSKGGQIAPEVQLAFMLGGSAFLTHVGQTVDFDAMKNLVQGLTQPAQAQAPAEGAFSKRPSMRRPSAPPPAPAPAPAAPAMAYQSEIEELRRERAELQAQLHQQVSLPPRFKGPMTTPDFEILE